MEKRPPHLLGNLHPKNVLAGPQRVLLVAQEELVLQNCLTLGVDETREQLGHDRGVSRVEDKEHVLLCY
eukprot:2013545-Prorocentrum_lima.AAC.1